MWIFRSLADDAAALYATRHDHYGYPKGSRKTSEMNDSLLGPKVVLYDMMRAQGWDLASHGGFVTYPHHDASGFVTYVFVRSGAKIWGIQRVMYEHLPNARNKLYEEFDKILDDVNGNGLSDTAEMGTLLLEEGDVL